jgi:hypothetical protein
MSTHPVGDYHHIVQFVCTVGHVVGRKAGHQRLQGASHPCDEKLIFVVLAAVTCVCQRVDIDVHQRREGAVLRLDQRSVSRG